MLQKYYRNNSYNTDKTQMEGWEIKNKEIG